MGQVRRGERADWRTWRVAMSDALYGPAGFYRGATVPGRHFRTAAHTGPEWAGSIATLAHRVDDALGRPAGFTVVDVGAGGGELLRELTRDAPSRWRLVGVDFAPPPPDLPERVQWQAEPPTSVAGLLVAVELLDVVPVEIVERTSTGIRLVEVDTRGAERLGRRPDAADVQWLSRWWGNPQIGDRTEIGRSRDAMWESLCSVLTRGTAVAIDYRSEPTYRAGTLTGFRDGRQVAPVPDGSCDLTAHVCFESLQRPGDVVMSQREALRVLGVNGRQPTYDGDSAAYLGVLASVGRAAELLDANGLGNFAWLLRPVAIANPLAADPEPARLRSRPGRRTSARTSSTHR